MFASGTLMLISYDLKIRLNFGSFVWAVLASGTLMKISYEPETRLNMRKKKTKAWAQGELAATGSSAQRSQASEV